MGRLGVGWDVLHARNPRLIYCNISGFGPDGPYAKRPAYDTVAQSRSGFFSQLLDPDRPRIAGPAIADAISGLYAAFGIASALAARTRDGVGHRLDIPMVEVMAAFSADPLAQYFANGRAPGPYERASVSQSFALRCADGKLIGLHLSSPPKFWESLLAAIERPDIGRDPRFAERSGRTRNFNALCDVLGEAFATRPRAECTFFTQDHPQLGPLRGVQGPVWCDRAREVPELPPPALGEHTDEQLRRAGYSDSELAELRAAGVV
jgi:crotonobetainyl-CoA:carnitine CoA-transferase CaiB-like acyl-CoA transferase